MQKVSYPVNKWWNQGLTSGCPPGHQVVHHHEVTHLCHTLTVTLELALQSSHLALYHSPEMALKVSLLENIDILRPCRRHGQSLYIPRLLLLAWNMPCWTLHSDNVVIHSFLVVWSLSTSHICMLSNAWGKTKSLSKLAVSHVPKTQWALGIHAMHMYWMNNSINLLARWKEENFDAPS